MSENTETLFMFGLLFTILMISGFLNLDTGALKPWLDIVNRNSGIAGLSYGMLALIGTGLLIVISEVEKI